MVAIEGEAEVNATLPMATFIVALLSVAAQVAVVPQSRSTVPGTVIEASGKVTVRGALWAKASVVAVEAVAPDNEIASVLLAVLESANPVVVARFCVAPRVATVPEVAGNVMVVASVPVKVMVLLMTGALPPAIVSVPPVTEAIKLDTHPNVFAPVCWQTEVTDGLVIVV